MRTMTASSLLSQVPVGPSVVGPAEFSRDAGIHDLEIPVYDPYSPGDSYAKPQAIGKLMTSTTLAARCQPTAGVATTVMLASQNTLAHYPFHTAQGSDDFESRQCIYALSYQIGPDRKVTIEGYSGLSYGPISHSSLQSSSSMCFRTEHRTTKHRPAPYSVVYRQERSQGPIYNGNISGGVNVNNFNMSSGDGASRSPFATAFDNITSRYSTEIHERTRCDWGHARL
jgi:hypothetical protein